MKKRSQIYVIIISSAMLIASILILVVCFSQGEDERSTVVYKAVSGASIEESSEESSGDKSSVEKYSEESSEDESSVEECSEESSEDETSVEECSEELSEESSVEECSEELSEDESSVEECSEESSEDESSVEEGSEESSEDESPQNDRWIKCEYSVPGREDAFWADDYMSYRAFPDAKVYHGKIIDINLYLLFEKKPEQTYAIAVTMRYGSVEAEKSILPEVQKYIISQGIECDYKLVDSSSEDLSRHPYCKEAYLLLYANEEQFAALNFSGYEFGGKEMKLHSYLAYTAQYYGRYTLYPGGDL